MYGYELIQIYMDTKGYSQAKQASDDLALSNSQISMIKAGDRFLSEETALYIAKRCGLDEEEVILKLSEEKAKTPGEKAVWANILKKYKARAMESIEGFAMSLKANLINFA